MALISLNLIIFLVLSFLSVSRSTFLPTLTSTIADDATVPPPPPPPLFTTSPPPQSPQQDFPGQGIFSHTSALAPILSHLGFNELATAAPSLFGDSANAATWTGPYTIFAPSDSSILTCISCSIPSLLREHMVPGLFTSDYLRKLPFGSKFETLSPGRCITVTSTSSVKNDLTVYKIFIGGVEITHPDLFNNGLIVVHGLQGYISHLSPFSCDVERMTSSLALQFHYDRSHSNQLSPQQHVALMRFMLRDVILRLRNSGFSVLSLALKLKYAELVSLRNVTIFALDDVSIFSGSYSYINSVRLHILPNRLLTVADLERLPVGTTLTTLDRDQSLVVTTEGGIMRKQMRINYVSIKVADMIRNLNVIVHSLYLPFPHVYPMVATTDSTLGGEDQNHQTPALPGATTDATLGGEDQSHQTPTLPGATSDSTLGGEEQSHQTPTVPGATSDSTLGGEDQNHQPPTVPGATSDSTLGGEAQSHQPPTVPGIADSCESVDEQGKCGMSQVNHVETRVKPPHYIPEIEDHHGL
ncbi:hypothetical protein HRI_000534500 [Hibiscus trionum]|uniref:FAS1 domain-containing protein n=1 Tax=Hibiscus trionum TaxID=183268 RepID=A0A9W7H0Y8_HIBTR|nr:hypothetical protein HRI_000534500 [Hibiscus trionum]